MNEKELKPCPFCGGTASLNDAWPHWAYCTVCGAKVQSVKFDEEGDAEAIAKWNRRVEVKAEVLTIDQVKALGNSDYDSPYLDDAKRSFVWWESSPSARFPNRNQLWLVRLSYSFHPEWDDDESLYEIEGYVTGSEIPLSGGASEYNKTWRCWNRKPATEQRQGAKWDE